MTDTPSNKDAPIVVVAADEEALNLFSRRWKVDGDYMRCRSCDRPQLTRFATNAFPHASDCDAIAYTDAHPWLLLAGLLRPLDRLAALAPSAAVVDDATLTQALTDPENQPSQWGTIPLAMLPAAMPLPYGDGPMDCPTEADEHSEQGYAQGWNAYRAALSAAALVRVEGPVAEGVPRYKYVAGLGMVNMADGSGDWVRYIDVAAPPQPPAAQGDGEWIVCRQCMREQSECGCEDAP